MPKILLVEDEDIISEPLGYVLRSQNYHVDIAANGDEALKLCKKQKYDLILLDIMMPVCNGVEFLERANLDKTSPGTKVVLLTNLGSGKEIENAQKLGAKQSLLKAAITPTILINLVKEEIDSNKDEVLAA